MDTKIQELFINGTQSGSMCLNDTMMQYASKQKLGFAVAVTRNEIIAVVVVESVFTFPNH